MNRVSDEKLDELERQSLKPYRSMILPTMQVRQIIAELRELRDAVCVLQMKVEGGRAIIDAVETAARVDADTRLSAIQIERPDGPPFHLVDALRRGQP